MAKYAHVVMGGEIVIAGYWNPSYAMMHARCLTGCTISTVDLEQLQPAARALVESQILSELPDDIRKDIEIAEWEEEDVTPRVQMTLEDLDDQVSDGIPTGVDPENSLSIPLEDDDESR